MNASRSSESRDRLRELPDALISHIFWMLPMKDVVRTTILSKNWKNLWTTISCLNFDNGLTYTYDTEIFRVFVYRALMFWKGVTIQKFKIQVCTGVYMELASDIDAWVRFAMNNRVQELYLHFNSYEQYPVPQYLLSYSSFKVLSLKDCSLQTNGSVQWNQLKSLTLSLRGEISWSDDVINRVMSGCPRLETLILTNNERFPIPNLSIRSTSLKWLSIYNYLYYYYGDDILDGIHVMKTSELRIRTPNLETLEMSGFPFARCSLECVSSLTRATLDFFDPHTDFDNGFHEEALRQIFPIIRNVQNVTFSNWCIEVLGKMKKKNLLSTLWNVTFLKMVRCSFENFVVKAGLLEIFPQVKSLVIEVADQPAAALMFDAKSHLNFQTSLPDFFLQQLRTVEVTWAESNHSLFPMIQILLKHACKLEKMVFRVKGRFTSLETLFMASQKLLRMQRSSPTAELIFLS